MFYYLNSLMFYQNDTTIYHNKSMIIPHDADDKITKKKKKTNKQSKDLDLYEKNYFIMKKIIKRDTR